MYYSSFRIQNFKGIKDTTIKLSGQSKIGVFAFVGLNESGKTTILEAIHSFSPDPATSELVGLVKGEGKPDIMPFEEMVPRHLMSHFTGDVSVTATIKLEGDEKKEIIASIQSEHKITLELETPNDEIIIEMKAEFKNGDFVENYLTIENDMKIKLPRQRSWRIPHNEQHIEIRNVILKYTPSIAYFPTFAFNFPERIFLTENREDGVSKYYKEAFQDILDFDGRRRNIEESQRLTIEEAIVRRVCNEDKEDKNKIQQVMDRASIAVTEVVFGRWNEIFSEDVKDKKRGKGKEIIISHGTLEKNSPTENTEIDKYDIFIKFQIKDGSKRFDINHSSLGFRWFFAFMLFTQFRVAREKTRPVFFLFDEPASNLHAAAQQKLIESFPKIAKGSHTLAYTTHSHYMIEPKWLEQTFVVTNGADTPNDSIIDTVSIDDRSLNIKASPYRSFVNEHPSQISYFQPILDSLEVAPSRFDIEKNSILLEGKSDYYILRYAAELFGRDNLALIPGLGAGTFDSLLSLSIGWSLNILFVLDSDKKGIEERERYIRKYGLTEDRVITISELVDEVKTIESLLDNEARKIISNKLELGDKEPTKDQVWRYFQESLACDNVHPLGNAFETKTKQILDELEKRILELRILESKGD